MKAMQYQGYGGPDRLSLTEIPEPRPSESQLLVKVGASSVNPVDWKLHNGSFRWLMPVKFPSVPGFDLAGEVVEVGAKVERFKPGDRVFAMLDHRPGGADAEYAVVGETAAAPMPSNLDAREAAAVPLAGLTALQALRDNGRLGAGQCVLIIGGSGGVGHFAVQIAKARGARVTAVCSTPHVEMVRGLGADHVIDYKKQTGFAADEPYDLIFDTILSSPFRAFLPVMARKGVFVATLPTPSLLVRAVFMPLYSSRRVKLVGVRPRGEDLRYLGGLIEASKLRPVIDRVFRLEELASAHAMSQGGRTVGKIVVNVDGS